MLHLLSGEQHVSPLMDLPDESLCFPHAVVALPLPPRMLYLQEIQLGTASVEQNPAEIQRKMKWERNNNRGEAKTKEENESGGFRMVWKRRD